MAFIRKLSTAPINASHVFQGRYKAVIGEKDSYLLELARYVVLNPLRARMVKNAAIGEIPCAQRRPLAKPLN